MRYLTLICCTLLSGCLSVGPDGSPPVAQLPAHWQQTENRPLPDRWWQQFNAPELSALTVDVAQRNVDLRLASLRLQQSQAALQITSAALLPTLDAGASYQRQRATSVGSMDPSGYGGEQDFSHWTGGLSSRWELDMWGKLRHQREAAQAQLAWQEDDRRAVLTSLMAEAAADYLRYRASSAQIAIAQQGLTRARDSLRLTRVRQQNGAASQLDVDRAAADVSTLEAQLPLLRDARHRSLNAISLLLAEAPGSSERRFSPQPGFTGWQGPLPTGLPATLARRRPDIRQAEDRLRQATAETAVATADFYPSITLTGSVGYEALQLADFGSWATHFFAVGPVIHLPLFSGGRLRGQLALKQAQQQQAALRYQHTVLSAWHEIDNALNETRARQLQAQQLTRVVSDNQHAFTLATTRYRSGASGFLDVLTSQREWQQSQSQQVTARLEGTLAVVALYRALGGGWQQTYPDRATGG